MFKETMYGRVQIELEGTVYQGPELITADIIKRFSEMQFRAISEPEAAGECVKMLFGVPDEVIARKDIRVLRDINQYFAEAVSQPETASKKKAS